MKIQSLRRKYPKFIYEKYSYKISGRNLEIFFDFRVQRENKVLSKTGSYFKIPPDIKFKPKIIIERIDLSAEALAKADKNLLDNLIFNLGLMEIPSYWKATCSPEIVIKAGYLNKEQIKWWQNLISKGMSQFFYTNKINFLKPKFTISYFGEKLTIVSFSPKLKNRYLVPFAGGRDSIVTLESLKSSFAKASKDRKREIALFTVNPIEKIQKTVKVSGIKKQIIVRRIIDKKLLELNKKGFLNGHTPFTSLLSFISVLCAVLFDYKNIAFSNEKSSNEGNVKYLGRTINHQWAKSSEFEKMFKDYCRKYLVKDLNYFSFLRKMGELEISKKLARYKKYFPVFSSCNAGMKMNAKGTLHAKRRWCCECPKCLFVYLSLYPYLEKKDLMMIFGKDIFQNRKLLSTMKSLLGQGTYKPFECVGTKAESKKAFKLSLEKAKKEGEIPYLLK